MFPLNLNKKALEGDKTSAYNNDKPN